MNILVTGIAGDIGSSICKILKGQSFINNIIGADIHTDHLHTSYCNKFVLMPRVKEANYLKSLKEIIKSHEIDIVIPSFEEEQKFLSKSYADRNIDGSKIVLADDNSLLIGFDKLKTSNFLKDNNFPYPWTFPLPENNPKTYPCILKNRFSSGSKDIKIIYDDENIESYKKIYNDFIWQEYIDVRNEEYTCGVYRSKKKEVRIIIFKRRLSLGITMYAEVIKNKTIYNLCENVAHKMNLFGSINIQLKLKSGTPIIFEINPRFSSTVIFRHLLGFEDLIWSIHENTNNELPNYNEREIENFKMYRQFREIITTY